MSLGPDLAKCHNIDLAHADTAHGKMKICKHYPTVQNGALLTQLPMYQQVFIDPFQARTGSNLMKTQIKS